MCSAHLLELGSCCFDDFLECSNLKGISFGLVFHLRSPGVEVRSKLFVPLFKKTLFPGSCLRWSLATFLKAQEIKYLIGKLFSRIEKTPALLAYVQYLI